MTKVVVIDDDTRVLGFLRAVLSRHGFEVHLASNGLDGLKLVARTHPELVITDVIMPGIDGARVSAEIREHFPEIAIMAISGSESGIVDALSHGADRMILKPFEPSDLISAIDWMLPERNAGQSSPAI